MLNKAKKSLIILILFAISYIYFLPMLTYAVDYPIGQDSLIRLNIKGEDKTVRKTTTVDEIKQWYAGEHSLETTSLFGGNAYSFWVGDSYDDYLYIETIEDGTIFSYGAVDKTYKTNTYSYGDAYPYKERTPLYGALTADDSKVVGGIYYNKVNSYYNGLASRIISAYKEAFLADQNTALLNLNKHATPMFNAMLNEYGNNSFLTFNEQYFNKDASLKEEGSSLMNYVIDMSYSNKLYTSIGADANVDLAYSNYYLLNPLLFAGMAKLRKNTDFGQRNYPVWSYNYEKKSIIAGAYSPDCLGAEYEIDEKTLKMEKVILEAFTSIDDKMPTINKARNLINYMVEDVYYTFDDRSSDQAYNALVYRYGKCSDSATGTNKLLRRAGIPSYGVTSLTADHAWNLYNIDGEWTYGDNVFHIGWQPARVQKAYFYSKSQLTDTLSGLSWTHIFDDFTSSNSYLTEFPEGKSFDESPSYNSRIYIDDNYYYCSASYSVLDNTSIIKIDRKNTKNLITIASNTANGLAKKGDRIYYIKADRKTVASCDLNGKNERVEKIFNDCKAGEDSPKRLDGIYAKDGEIKVYYHEKSKGYTQDEECVITTTSTYPTLESKIYNDAEHKYKMLYIKNDTAVEIMKLAGLNSGDYAEGKIDIPEKIDGLPVIGIGPKAFTSKGLFGSVTLPSSVRFIGEYAFNNKNITEINLNEGLKSIDNFAFNACDISSINLPSSVTYMGEDVFANNDKLTSIAFPENLQCAINVISESNRCNNLTSVAYKNDNMDQVFALGSFTDQAKTKYDLYVTPGSKTEDLLKTDGRTIYDIKDFGNHFIKKYYSLDTTDIQKIDVVVPGQLQGMPAELEDGTFVQVKYKSSNPDVVRVTDDGYSFQSTGKPGFATITAEETDSKYGTLKYIVFSKYRGEYNLPTNTGNTYVDKRSVFCGDLNNNLAWDTGDLKLMETKIKLNNVTEENIPLYDINGDGLATMEDYILFKEIIYNGRIQIGNIPITAISTSEDGLDTSESWWTTANWNEYAEYKEISYTLSTSVYPSPSNTTEQLKIIDVEIKDENIVQLESIDNDNGVISFKCLKRGKTQAILTTDKGISSTLYNITVGDEQIPKIELNNKSVKSVNVEDFEKNLKVGDETKIEAISYPLAVHSGKVEYISSNPEVVYIDDSGYARAVEAGNSTITIKADDVEKSYEITVTDNLKGDINEDGDVDLIDCALLLRHAKGIEQLDGNQVKNADINEDGDVDLIDYAILLRHVKGIELLY